MVRQPTTLTPKVPQGNPEATCPCTNLDSKYLATPPMKLPDPTKRSIFSITIKKLLDSKTRESPPGKILPYSFYPVKTGQNPVACNKQRSLVNDGKSGKPSCRNPPKDQKALCRRMFFLTGKCLPFSEKSHLEIFSSAKAQKNGRNRFPIFTWPLPSCHKDTILSVKLPIIKQKNNPTSYNA